MSAPPPPPPPPPSLSNLPKPNNKDLLSSICKGTTLKKVPDNAKNDRSAALLDTKPKSSNTGPSNLGPRGPPIGGSIADAILARKNVLANPSSSINVKRTGVPLPNSAEATIAPPPPSQSKKPITQTVPFIPPSQLQNNKPPISFLPPPPPIQNSNNFPSINGNIPPPPPPKDIKPRFRPPMPLNKPMANSLNERPSISEAPKNLGRSINMPPLPPPNEVRPPQFAPPPPPPSQARAALPSEKNKLLKPALPVRMDSKADFDSKFTFVDVKYFPDPASLNKMRHT